MLPYRAKCQKIKILFIGLTQGKCSSLTFTSRYVDSVPSYQGSVVSLPSSTVPHHILNLLYYTLQHSKPWGRVYDLGKCFFNVILISGKFGLIVHKNINKGCQLCRKCLFVCLFIYLFIYIYIY